LTVSDLTEFRADSEEFAPSSQCVSFFSGFSSTEAAMSDESELDPTFIIVRCEECSAKLRVRGTLAGRVGECPECHAALPIPELPDYGIEDDSDDDRNLSPWNEAAHSYRLATPLEYEPDFAGPPPLPKELTAPAPLKGYLDQLGQVRQIVIPKPPRLIFFSGVFEFPWYDEVWPRWIWLMLGGIALSLIPVFAIGVLDGAGGYRGIMLAFLAIPQIWLSLWTGSHAACCGLRVFEETAAGNDHISGWPDPNWREWMLPFVQQGAVAFVIGALAYGLGLALGLAVLPMAATIGLAEFFLFPFCWLSVMEGNSLLFLVSTKVLRTLWKKPVSWVTFYGLTGLLLAIWGVLCRESCRVSLMFGMFLNGLLFATFVLIYFRLLGRLAWSVSHPERRKRKPSPRKPSN
jgi:hypothetical protein